MIVGVWPPVSTRQDMCRTIRGDPAHKIKACTVLLGVHRKGSNLVNKMNEQMQWDIKVSQREMHLKPNESFGYVPLQLL